MLPSTVFDQGATMIIKPQSQSAGTVDSSSVDTKECGEVAFYLFCGTTSSGGTLDVKVQESDDDSSFTDVTNAAFTQVTPSNDDAMYVGVVKAGIGRKRYMRLRSVAATAASIIAAAAIRGGEFKAGQLTTTTAFVV